MKQNEFILIFFLQPKKPKDKNKKDKKDKNDDKKVVLAEWLFFLREHLPSDRLDLTSWFLAFCLSLEIELI